MQTLSATDVKQAFGAALDAAQRSPVVIRKQNRDVAVLMSMREYEKIRQMRIENFDRTAKIISDKALAKGMTNEILAELLADVS
jgi:prevent-host-death family protein